MHARGLTAALAASLQVVSAHVNSTAWSSSHATGSGYSMMSVLANISSSAGSPGISPVPVVSSVTATAGAGSNTSAAGSAPSSTVSASGATYTNPILNAGGADPWMINPGDGYYYLTFSNNVNITLYRSRTLTDWNTAESQTLWTPPPGMDYSTDLWAPEIHFLDNRWYVIFTADPNSDTPPPQISAFCTFDCPAFYHRMYVLESSGSDIWTSTYSFKSQLDTFDQFAIDGTYFQLPSTNNDDSQLFHVYSCWYSQYESWPANLCITQMSNPYTISSNLTERTIISVPSQPWEQTPYGRAITGNVRLASNEGPEQLTSPITGQQFIVYSAARSDNPDYCLGLLALKIGGDPMNEQDWVKSDGCVFYQDKRSGAYGVGHASFVTSPDGKEWYIIYHGMNNPWNGWSARTIRAQKFTWDEVTGYPIFPRPGYGPYPDPSGQY